MFKWYGAHWSEIVKRLNSNIYAGLEEDSIKLLHQSYGKNLIKLPKSKSFLCLMLTQVKQLWVLLLIASIGIFIFLNKYTIAIMVFIIIAINIFLIVSNQYAEEKDLKELHKLNLGMARVIREGNIVKIQSGNIAVGDIIIVDKGETVPADLRIIECENLRVYEGSVTGEKFISEKYATRIDDREISLSEMKNLLFKSSSIADGSATGIVIATGMNTQISSIIGLLNEESNKGSIFYSRLNHINNRFCEIILLLIVIGAGVNYYLNEDIYIVLNFISNTLFVSIPYSIIFIVTILSSIVINGFKEQGIYLKNLPVVEKSSIINVMCVEKIGSFSKVKMRVEGVYCNNELKSKDELLDEFNKGKSNESLQRLMSVAMLCNDSNVEVRKHSNTKLELIDEALVMFLLKASLKKKEMERKHRRILNIPYDTERRLMTTVNMFDGYCVANVKGALDALLVRCTHIIKNGAEVELTEEDINFIKNADIKMSTGGLAVLGFAYRSFSYEPSLKENIESHLVFTGLFGFESPLNEEAKSSIEKSRALGIRPVIFTDDNIITAYSVGKELGFTHNELQIFSGVEIDNMSEKEFGNMVERTSIFSRITDIQKSKIIKLLKEKEYYVAVTGARITELPAINIADVGITASDSRIIKKLSDVFLKNLNYWNLLEVIEDSRRSLETVKKLICYVFSVNFSALIYMLLAVVFNFNYTINAFEALWFNCFTLVLSSLAFILQYKEEKAALPRFVIGKSILAENKATIFLKSSLLGVLAFLCANFSFSYGEGFAKLIGLLVLNCGAIIFVLDFINYKMFKNIYSKILIIANVVIQVAVVFIIILHNKVSWKPSSFIFAILAILLWVVFVYYVKNKKDYT